ncbi:glycosyltransferase [Phormidium tenue FACHB-886]|nr:glycosyltransferase [Phormidium tenue FACHB-886]
MAVNPPSRANLPQVSVIIPIYNGEADLPDLLRCLQQQTYAEAEYLLIDNGSNDRTSQILATLAPPFYGLSEAQIQSAYAARNVGIGAAKGSILAFTDADCRPQSDWLAQLVQPFDQPSVGIVAGEIAALPGDSLLERYADRHETLSQKHTLAHSFCAYGQTANLAVRRSAFEQVGLFRPYLTTGGDADICWRILRQTDWQIKFAPTASVQHRHRTTLAALDSQWRRYGRSNRYLHDLHNIDLAKELTWQDVLYRGSRWLLKEVPLALMGKRNIGLIDTLVDTPLSLFCGRARTLGQRNAQIAEQMGVVVWLANELPNPPLTESLGR